MKVCDICGDEDNGNISLEGDINRDGICDRCMKVVDVEYRIEALLAMLENLKLISQHTASQILSRKINALASNVS
jgi:hypothetical protein